MQDLKVFIIIVTYNDLKHTCECLESLEKLETKNLKLKIIVIDNASFKFKPNILKQKFPYILLIKNKKNLGFGRANNIGIKLALKNKADFVLLLNPDTKADIDKNFLNKLIRVGMENKNIGILGPCIKHQVNKKTLYDYGGVLNVNLVRARHINKVQSSLQKGGQAKFKVQSSIERDFVTGACMLIKKEVFEKNVFFDPAYFLYLEDVDFCLQAKKAGFKIVNVSSAQIFHYGGTSITDNKKILQSFKSSVRFTIKWTPLIYRPISFLYNSLFYPYLLISWSLKRMKRGFLRSL